MELGNIHQFAGGLNIEGGYPCRDLHKTNSYGKWINCILVLDRPFVDKITFDEIFNNNKYPLLENAVECLNENHFLATYLMIIGYYLDNGHKLFNKNNNEKLFITIHIHQDKASKPLVDILKNYVDLMIDDDNINLRNKNLSLEYLTDDKTYVCSEHNYRNTDLLISLSQCAGLDPKFEPGTLFVPIKFIPYHIDTKCINISDAYETENQLDIDLCNILASGYNTLSVDFINNNYLSSNPAKKHLAKILTASDFNYTNILQVDKLWNPVDVKELVMIV